MATFEQGTELPFFPDFNNDGFCSLTFLGFESKVDKFTDDVEEQTNILRFEVASVEGTTKEVQITFGSIYKTDSVMGITLSAMGFAETQVGISVDIGLFKNSENGDYKMRNIILDFIKSSEGNVYLAKMYKENGNPSGHIWEVNINTLKPYQENPEG
ncbi:hypothetical protein [Nodularia sphaerocarpa]|uniref:hypothetical protein n=1 Tax=Nodularia sphaerocarpa TaxID=137816 RepID=UPI001EFBC889|nr:hypothetical protein [Nodularia sphaerocarpa]MDB9375819.1 hypothetical protein [Nodularia sphaerocarpa CS-585]MDB9380092.1 hypothetical protein [Nodularia sphaerocarpa CS-585A2]ULP71863.1 hypothetical protein BDGGKGIB_01500 [Nodularia sphaerocarpa UHCC 0038]